MEDRSNLQRYSMLMGTYLGIYWVLKFCFFPLGMERPFLMMLFWGLTLAGPFMALYLARIYRDQVLGGVIGFTHAFTFCLFEYLYAALLAAVAHYVYYAFIDSGYILSTYSDLVDQMAQQSQEFSDAYKDQFHQILDLFSAMKPIDMTVEQLSMNLFWGFFLSVFSALALKRKPQQ